MEFRMIRTGKVSSINYKHCRARVEFDDASGIISKELNILSTNSNKTKDYVTATIGEEVVCVFSPHASSVGFIVGPYYSGKNLPPKDGKIKYIFFPDGTRLKYDMEPHMLEIDSCGDIEVKAAKNVLITAKNLSIVAETPSIYAITDIKKKVAALEIDSKKISTPKENIDLHKHKDADSKERVGSCTSINRFKEGIGNVYSFTGSQY